MNLLIVLSYGFLVFVIYVLHHLAREASDVAHRLLAENIELREENKHLQSLLVEKVLKMETKACLGGRTRTVRKAGGDMEECVFCGTQVRWDLVDHYFFGFRNQGCQHMDKDTDDE